ncbi:MAG: Wzz/FepE/Etk N-terminal domain-containing protein [bacterium]|nr:Wzz/FepE/Etk N-terminal domain-containing protein [bacterium]
MAEQPKPAAFPTSELINTLFKRWWVVALVTFVVGLATFLYAQTLPNYFEASINCVPPRADNSLTGGALGGLSSTLKDIGLTKMGGKSSEGYEFVVLLYTRSIRDSMISRFKLHEEYELQGESMSTVRDEFEKNLEIEYLPEGNYTISIWSRSAEKAVEMCEGFVQEANSLANRVQREEASKAAAYLEQRMAKMDSSLATLSDSLSMYARKYLIFSPTDQAKAASVALATGKAEVWRQETLLGLLQQSYGAEDPQVRTQRQLVEQLQQSYRRMETQPGMAGNLSISDGASVGVRYLRVYAEFEAFSKIKAFLMPSLEQTHLDMNKTSPSLLVVDHPEVAEKKSKPKRSLIAGGAGLGAGVLTLCILIIAFAWKQYRRNHPRI